MAVFYRVNPDTTTSKREMQDPKAGLEEHHNVLLLLVPQVYSVPKPAGELRQGGPLT